MSPDAAERMRVYQEGQRSASDDAAMCPYGLFDWRRKTWWKGRKAAQDYNAGIEATLTQQAEPTVDERLAGLLKEVAACADKACLKCPNVRCRMSGKCAYAEQLRRVQQQAEPVVEPEQPNLWRDAVDDELASLHMVASDDPRESIRRLIDWHCAVQIDPLVSSAAQELIERGKREALEQPVTISVVRSAVAIVAAWSARTKALRDFEPADRFAIGEAIDMLRAALKRAGLVAVPANVVAFLRGTAPLNGCNFGEKPENERGEFWWRKHLPTISAEPVVDRVHDLYADADTDKPAAILDWNGEVVLGLCKRCGKAESELSEPCVQQAEPVVEPERGRRPHGWKTQQAEPVQSLVSDAEYIRIFDAARNGSDRPAGKLRGIRAVIAAYERATPPQQAEQGETMSNEQPEALRLADELDNRVVPRFVYSTGGSPRISGCKQDSECALAAAELRRLHEENKELLVALKALFDDYKSLADSGDCGNWSLEDTDEGKAAIAAIRKAEGT